MVVFKNNSCLAILDRKGSIAYYMIHDKGKSIVPAESSNPNIELSSAISNPDENLCIFYSKNTCYINYDMQMYSVAYQNIEHVSLVLDLTSSNTYIMLYVCSISLI